MAQKVGQALRQQVKDPALIIVVGDHQPPVFISGEGAGADVPIHIISGDPRLLEPFLAAGFAPGMRPAADRPASRMDAFRDFFFRVFSASPGPAHDSRSE